MNDRLPDARSDQSRLDTLLDLNDPVADWSDEDLKAMLRHQLSQPLEAGQPSIRDLLAGAHPPVEGLESIKRHAKLRRARTNPAVAQDLWRVVYFAALAAAIRSGQRISNLSSQELRQGLEWTLARPWLDDSVRDAVQQAHARLTGEP